MAKKKKKTFGKRRKGGRKKKKQTSLLGRAVKWGFVLGLWFGIFLALLLAWYAQELPDITKDPQFERDASIVIKAADGSTIARYGETKGESITTADMPAYLIYAVIAIEDRRFYQHHGLDPLGIARAMVTNARHMRFVQGGSTITQQLAKNLFLSRERTLKRKIQEAMLAFWLEHELTKDEILSAYLNRVYMGSGTYGVDAASRLYFKKAVKDINLQEAATLAGLLKAPSRYSPLRNPGLSKDRADVVLRAMADAGYLSEDDVKNMTDLPPTPQIKPSGGNSVRYFTDWVVDGINDLIGTPEQDIIVETTLQPRLQKNAEEALLRILTQYGEEHVMSQGAGVILDHYGAVLAMVGGRNYSESQFNRITQAKRQPGSAFKPIVYLTALEMGWKPDDLILDAPITEGKYRPRNFTKEYRGEITLEEALTYSINTAAVRLMKEIKPQPVINTARRLGIYSHLEADLSLALGSSSISPLELSVAYATIGNGGFAVFPYAITRIEDKEGYVYYNRRRNRALRRVVEPRYIRDITNMLRSVVVNGTGRGAQISVFAAGKTGTSQESRDAWFAGFTDKTVGVVWFGNDDNTPMKNVTGGSLPAIAWREMMGRSYRQYTPPQASYTYVSDTPRHGNMGRLLDKLTNPPYNKRLPEHRSYYNQ